MLAFNFGSSEHFWSKCPRFLPCCAAVCPWEQFQDIPGSHWCRDDLHLLRGDKALVLFSQYHPCFECLRTVTNVPEHLPWCLITVSKSRWCLLLKFTVVVKHLRSGDTSWPQQLALSGVMVDKQIHPKNSPRENAGEKIILFLIWKAMCGTLLFQR